MVVQHGIEANADFLQKPYSLAAFGRKVREVLDAERPNGPEQEHTNNASHDAA